MRKPYHLQKFWRVCMLLALVLGLSVAPGAAVPAHAQGVPPACMTDSGQPVRPNPAYLDPGWSSAWVLILNFNHKPSMAATVGCLGTITQANPNDVVYTIVSCPVINNTAGVMVGNGTSQYDGNFWVECPGVTSNNYPHSSFGVWGRVRFPMMGDSLTLLNHSDVKFTVNSAPILPSTLESRYGKDLFTNSTMGGMVGNIISVKSEIDNYSGRHYVNGTALLPPFAPNSFGFDESQPMRIGAAGQHATLFEVIIDPPGHCCVS